MERIEMSSENSHCSALAGLLLSAVLAAYVPVATVCRADEPAPVKREQGDKAKPPGKSRIVELVEGLKGVFRGPTTKPAEPEEPIDPALTKTLKGCRELYLKGRYIPAADGYRKLTDTKELRVSAAIGQAEALAIVGKYDEAREALEKVETEGAARAEWRLAMAEALSTVGEYDKALTLAAKANELRPAWAPAIFVRGQLLETVGRKADAIAVYKSMSEAIEADKYRNDARSLVALGRILDRYAILTGQRASEQASNILHNYLQEAYLKADKNYWPAHVAAGMFLLSKHRPEPAVKEFELAAKINKSIPDVEVGLGALALGRWQFEVCEAQVAKALKVNPKHADALLLKAVCLMQWRKFGQVPAMVEKVLKINPNHLEALSLMAAAYIRMYEPDKAQPYIERVRKINAGYAGLPNAIGRWLAAGRQFDLAEKHYREAIGLAPELAGPVTDLGRMYMQTGDEDKALETLEKAHEIDNFRSDIVNTLKLLNKMKKYEVLETDHFIVKVDGQHDMVLLQQVADYMERIHKDLVEDFDYEPPEKTIIEFFPTHSDFSVRITGRGWIGTVGACTGRVIALAAPNTERSPLGTHNWATVLRHEYAHAVTLAATRNRIPHWFTEACAVFQQPDKRNYNFVQMLVMATRTGRLFPIKQLDWGFIRPRRQGDRSLAYAQSEWVLEYIIEKKGFGTVPEMLKAFREGTPQAEVFEKIIGVKEKDFDKAFRTWAKAAIEEWGFNPEPPPNYDKAAAEAKKKPQDAKAQAAFAVALYYRREFPQAEKAARKALKLDAENSRAMSVLAAVLADQGKYDEAITTAEALERADHTTSHAPRVLARCHIARKNWTEAIKALELLQQRQPLDSFSYDKLAGIYTQLGQPEKALPNLIHLHRHTMKDAKYARQIAEIYRTLNQGEQALAYFEQITHINPYQANAYEAMAAIYRSQRQYDEAAAVIENVRLLQPDSADAWAKVAMMRYLAARAANDTDRLVEAKRAAEKALELDPESQAGQILERVDAALETMGAHP